MELIRCPHCGQAYFTVMYSICTAIAWQPIYKNGRLMNKNPNYITDFCYCLNCKQEFSVRIGGNENEYKRKPQNISPTPTTLSLGGEKNYEHQCC